MPVLFALLLKRVGGVYLASLTRADEMLQMPKDRDERGRKLHKTPENKSYIYVRLFYLSYGKRQVGNGI